MNNLTVPSDPGVLASVGAQRLVLLAGLLEQLTLCEEFCVRCADACLRSVRPSQLTGCIEGTLECAEACANTALQLLRRPAATPEIHLQVCADQCAACEFLCLDEGGAHDFCRLCAAICCRCEKSCLDFARATGGPVDRN